MKNDKKVHSLTQILIFIVNMTKMSFWTGRNKLKKCALIIKEGFSFSGIAIL